MNVVKIALQEHNLGNCFSSDVAFNKCCRFL